MFTKQTVFVVGAGGSFELKLPLGSLLKTQISDAINIKESAGSVFQGDGLVAQAIYTVFQKQDPGPYFEAGRKAANAIPQALSIDSFIGAHSHDDPTVLMGKLGICRCINEAERRSPLMPNVQGDPTDFTNVPDSWHRVFCQMAFEGVDLDDLEYIFDNVSIITFNYDRVIEFYIQQSLQAYYKLDDKRSREITQKLKVIHVFGQIGQAWHNGSGPHVVGYGEHLEPLQLYTLAGTIRTFTEDYQGAVHVKRLRELLTAAETVVYLGFSFMRSNVDLMSFAEPGKHKSVFASSLGIHDKNRERIEPYVRQSLGGANVDRIEFEPLGGYKFLQAYWWPILY